MLKVILSLKHRGIPASINFDRPNPNIDFDALNVQVVGDFMPLESAGEPLIMGVNSFGFGGSNAHSILCDFPSSEVATQHAPITECPPLILSANSPESLHARAGQFIDRLHDECTEQETYDVLHTAATHRQHLRCGLAIRGRTRTEIVDQLQAFRGGEPSSRWVTGERLEGADRVAFIYSGNGSQWRGMGQQLLDVPEFRRIVEQFDELFVPLSGWSIYDELLRAPDTARLEYTEVAQPTLVALQIGVTDLLRRHGITPAAVAGHSVGEIAAAYTSGALTLEQTVGLVYHRSGAQGETKGQGRMLAARLSPHATTDLLSDYPDLELAAINSPDSVTVAGAADSIEALAARLQAQEVYCRILDLDYAFHSATMDDVQAGFAAALGTLRTAPTSIDFVSTVTGGLLGGHELDSDYWWRNVRQPVLLQAAVETLINDRFGVFIEVGPHPVLLTYLREILNRTSNNAATIGLLSAIRRTIWQRCMPPSTKLICLARNRIRPRCSRGLATIKIYRLIRGIARNIDFARPKHPWRRYAITPY